EGIRGAQFERSTLNSPNYIHFTTKQNITNFKNIEKTYGPDLEIPLKPEYNSTGKATFEIIKDGLKVIRYSLNGDDVYEVDGTFINEPEVLSVPPTDPLTVSREGNLVIGDAGIFKVKVTIDSDSNFHETTKEIYVTIKKAKPDIAWSSDFPDPITYGDSKIELTQYIETSSDGEIKIYNIIGNTVYLLDNNNISIGNATDSKIEIRAFVDEDVNYKQNSVDKKFTIAKKVLKVKVENAEREYLANNPDFETVFIDFVFPDDVSSLGGTIAYKTSSDINSPVGDNYTIEVSGYTSDNYTFDYTEPFGKLKITKKEHPFTLNNIDMDYEKSTIDNKRELRADDIINMLSSDTTGEYSFVIVNDPGGALTPIRISFIEKKSNGTFWFRSGNAGVVNIKVTRAADSNFDIKTLYFDITINKISPHVGFMINDPDYGFNYIDPSRPANIILAATSESGDNNNFFYEFISQEGSVEYSPATTGTSINGNKLIIGYAGKNMAIKATQLESTNYLEDSDSDVFKINKASLGIEISEFDKDYGDVIPDLSKKFEYVNNDFRNGERAINVLPTTDVPPITSFPPPIIGFVPPKIEFDDNDVGQYSNAGEYTLKATNLDSSTNYTIRDASSSGSMKILRIVPDFEVLKIRKTY
ncbi:MAG: MBG-2 domain-containing protein, partial [Flavobacteriaceae bacterium]|nr:MBG-2 domain-containing protein [Flavobacteriaceae bacterium]